MLHDESALAQQIYSVGDAARDSQTVNYTYAVVLTLIVYDLLLTFHEEVAHVWMKPKTVYIALFFVVRYYSPAAMGLVLVVSINDNVNDLPHFCAAFLWWRVMGYNFAVQTVSDILVSTRVYALCSKSRLVLMSLSFLFVVKFSLEVVAMTLQLSSARHIAPAPLSGCTFTVPPYNYVIIADRLLNILFAVAIFFFTARQLYWSMEDGITWSNLVFMSQEQPINLLMLRDGCAFMVAFILADIFSAVCWFRLTSSNLASLAWPWNISVYAIATTRIVLNLRVKYNEPSFPTNLRDVELPERISFARRATDVTAEDDFQLGDPGRL